jgi:ribosomal-protein-serine acetyltransferase
MVSILIEDDILLRSLQLEDAPELFRAINASREHLRPWLNWIDSNTKPEHALQFIEHCVQEQDSQSGLVLGIFKNRQIIGEIGMHQWDHSLRKAQVGYWMSEEYAGKGILSKGLLRFLDFLYKKLDLNKVEIHFSPQNKASAKVAERLGFKVEGLLRQSYLRNGILEDLIVTGQLKSEWLTNELAISFNQPKESGSLS